MPKTADAHNANLTGRVEDDVHAPCWENFATLFARIKQLESENALLRERPLDFSDLEVTGSNSDDIGLSEKDGVYSVSLKHKPTGTIGSVDLPASFGSWLDGLRERLAFGAKTDGGET